LNAFAARDHAAVQSILRGERVACAAKIHAVMPLPLLPALASRKAVMGRACVPPGNAAKGARGVGQGRKASKSRDSAFRA
jgi:hypothetical protein